MEAQEEITLQGIPASPGVAHGLSMLHLHQELDIPEYDIEESDVESELERFDQAILETRQQITAIRNKIAGTLGDGEAQIFDAHQLVLEDRALLDEVILGVQQEKKNIEYCYHKVAKRYIDFFQSMEDEYLKERVSDIRDVSRRLLSNLLGLRRSDLGTLTEGHVLVSEELVPSDTADLDRNRLLAIVTDGGSRTSHSVIMARSIRIPAVVGLRDATRKIPAGADVLVDGYDGIVIINPTRQTLYRYGKIASARKRLDQVFAASLDEPSTTKDGHKVALMLNIESVADLQSEQSKKADGVGLFRTEALFLKHQTFPSEEIQYDEYVAVVKAMEGRPVTIRTLDLGGDKQFNQPSGPREDNPFMGYRAIRFCLDHETIFKAQLRAIIRASAFGKVKIMFPMISGLAELVQAKALVEEVKQELATAGVDFDKDLEVGCMIEIPSAASIVDLLAAESDFLSIGSNDLIQYLLAVDRLNQRVAHLYQPTHPAVLRVIQQVIRGGREAGVPVSVCGEIAGDPVFASLLIGMNVSCLSMTSAMLPEVKFFVRNFKRDEAEALTAKAMKTVSAREVAGHLQAFYQEHVGEMLSKVSRVNNGSESNGD